MARLRLGSDEGVAARDRIAGLRSAGAIFPSIATATAIESTETASTAKNAPSAPATANASRAIDPRTPVGNLRSLPVQRSIASARPDRPTGPAASATVMPAPSSSAVATAMTVPTASGQIPMSPTSSLPAAIPA
jgi:hypothetical protein